MNDRSLHHNFSQNTSRITKRLDLITDILTNLTESEFNRSGTISKLIGKRPNTIMAQASNLDSLNNDIGQFMRDSSEFLNKTKAFKAVLNSWPSGPCKSKANTAVLQLSDAERALGVVRATVNELSQCHDDERLKQNCAKVHYPGTMCLECQAIIPN